MQARVGEDFLLYEAFPYYHAKGDNRLKVRFKKVQHNLILKERKIKIRKKGEETVEEHDEFHDEKTQQFRYFENISGYSGVGIGQTYRGQNSTRPLVITSEI